MIDEVGQITGSEAIVLIMTKRPSKIIMVGDYFQLQTFVQSKEFSKVEYKKSLFECLSNQKRRMSTILNIQYRMHQMILTFPSQQFYLGQLKDGVFEEDCIK